MAENNDKLDMDQTQVPEPPPKEAPFAKPDAPAGGVTPPKRYTSRVPLPEGIAPAAPAAVPRTIRVIRPPSAGGGTPLPKPGVTPASPTAAPLAPSASGQLPPQAAAAAKAKTSRISLESAIGAQSVPAGGVEGAPKTIRLKRPSEMPTLKVPVVQPGTAKATSAIRASGPILPPAAGPSKTARIIGAEGLPQPAPLPTPEAAPAESVPLTQKRTIRVKRPGAITVSASRESAAADGADAMPALTPVSPEEAMGTELNDSCNPVFIIAAAASIIVTGVLIVVMYQQLFGPTAFY